MAASAGLQLIRRIHESLGRIRPPPQSLGFPYHSGLLQIAYAAAKEVSFQTVSGSPLAPGRSAFSSIASRASKSTSLTICHDEYALPRRKLRLKAASRAAWRCLATRRLTCEEKLQSGRALGSACWRSRLCSGSHARDRLLRPARQRPVGAPGAAGSSTTGGVAASGGSSGGAGGVSQDSCDKSACGPQLGLPNQICADGSTGGPTGRCLKNANGSCGWEIRQCPPGGTGGDGWRRCGRRRSSERRLRRQNLHCRSSVLWTRRMRSLHQQAQRPSLPEHVPDRSRWRWWDAELRRIARRGDQGASNRASVQSRVGQARCRVRWFARRSVLPDRCRSRFRHGSGQCGLLERAQSLPSELQSSVPAHRVHRAGSW